MTKLQEILLNYKAGKNSLIKSEILINKFFCCDKIYTPILGPVKFKPVNKTNKFVCEFKSVCKLRTCNYNCKRIMFTDYLIFKQNK